MFHLHRGIHCINRFCESFERSAMNHLSQNSQPSRKKIQKSGKDILSCLPDDVIDNILTRLNPRDAVRTSALSRIWRYKWTNLTDVIFQRQDFRRYENQSQIDYDRKVVRMIDTYLLLHQGPIYFFLLCTDLLSCEEIDKWVLSLSRNGIKHLALFKLIGPRYKVHSSILSCDLTFFCLYGCILIHPASVTGFRKLTILELKNATISDIVLASLVSNCPLLTKLVLIAIDGCSHLYICAPKLVKLEVESAFRDICLATTPVLTEASIKLLNTDGESHGSINGVTCKLIKVIGCLSHIRRLELLGSTLQVLTAGDVPVRLPTECSRLSYLSLALNFVDLKEVLIALCIFRSSPVLQKVDIVVGQSLTGKNNNEVLSDDDFWKSPKDFSCMFRRLRFIDFIKFTGSIGELKFLEFVLANGPVLETVHIRPKKSAADMMNALKKCNRFLRISSKATVIFPE